MAAPSAGSGAGKAHMTAVLKFSKYDVQTIAKKGNSALIHHCSCSWEWLEEILQDHGNLSISFCWATILATAKKRPANKSSPGQEPSYGDGQEQHARGGAPLPGSPFSLFPPARFLHSLFALQLCAGSVVLPRAHICRWGLAAWSLEPTEPWVVWLNIVLAEWPGPHQEPRWISLRPAGR